MVRRPALPVTIRWPAGRPNSLSEDHFIGSASPREIVARSLLLRHARADTPRPDFRHDW